MFLGVGDVDEGSCNCLSSRLFTPFLPFHTDELRSSYSSHSYQQSFNHALLSAHERLWRELVGMRVLPNVELRGVCFLYFLQAYMIAQHNHAFALPQTTK